MALAAPAAQPHTCCLRSGGSCHVNLAGDGEHTTLAWPEGSDLYFAGDYHDAVAAAALAVSSTALG